MSELSLNCHELNDGCNNERGLKVEEQGDVGF